MALRVGGVRMSRGVAGGGDERKEGRNDGRLGHDRRRMLIV